MQNILLPYYEKILLLSPVVFRGDYQMKASLRRLGIPVLDQRDRLISAFTHQGIDQKAAVRGYVVLPAQTDVRPPANDARGKQHFWSTHLRRVPGGDDGCPGSRVFSFMESIYDH